MNLYGFVKNNSINKLDRLGLACGVKVSPDQEDTTAGYKNQWPTVEARISSGNEGDCKNRIRVVASGNAFRRDFEPDPQRVGTRLDFDALAVGDCEVTVDIKSYENGHRFYTSSQGIAIAMKVVFAQVNPKLIRVSMVVSAVTHGGFADPTPAEGDIGTGGFPDTAFPQVDGVDHGEEPGSINWVGPGAYAPKTAKIREYFISCCEL